MVVGYRVMNEAYKFNETSDEVVEDNNAEDLEDDLEDEDDEEDDDETDESSDDEEAV